MGDIDPVERAQALGDPFLLLDYLAPPRFTTATAISPRLLLLYVALLILGSVVGGVLATVLEGALSRPRYGPNSEEFGFSIFVIGMLGTLVVGLVISAMLNRRRVRRTATPMVARMLRPLRPTDAEIDDVFAWQDAAGLRLGRLLKPAQVKAAVRTMPDTSLQNVDDLRIESWGAEIRSELQERASKDSGEA